MSASTVGWLLALLGWTALICFYDLDGGAGLEPSDCWVAQTAREMYESEDLTGYILPQYSTERRIHKSPGPYWAVCLASYLRGTPVDDVSVRIPNVVFAIAFVATVFWLTRRIAGDRAAIFAGFATASSTMILYWSHRGASDLGVATFCAISLACLWVAVADEPPGRRRTVYLLMGYLAAGFGMLYKLPMPLVCVGLPAFFYLLLRNRWRVLANRWHLVGLLLFLLPWAPWVIAAATLEPELAAIFSNKWRVEVLDRFTGDLSNVEKQRNWYFYLLYVGAALAFTVPYCLSLPNSIARAWRQKHGVNRDGLIFMLIWFFCLLAFFSASVGKEIRYFLPAMPPLFVLLGVELAALFDPKRPRNAALDRLAARAVWLLVPVGLAGLAALLYRWWDKHGQWGICEWGDLWPPYLVAAVVFYAGAALSARFYQRGQGNASFAALVATTWVGFLWLWPTLIAIVVSQATARDFARQLQDAVAPQDVSRIFMVAQQEPRIIWFSDYRFPRVLPALEQLQRTSGRRDQAQEKRMVAERMIELLERDEPVYLVAHRGHYVEFLTDAPEHLAAEGRALPALYLWLETRVGHKSHHYVMFSNRRPPWPELALEPPSAKLQAARAARSAALDEPPQSQPAGDG
jgi:4-amino-4-deoxy-L-arabinose transferase-like glycosyltransferase